MYKYRFFAFGIMLLQLFSYCGSSNKTTSSGTEVVIPSTKVSTTEATKPVKTSPEPPKKLDTETTLYIQKKYAPYLHTTPEAITNIKLYHFIDQWLNTPYLWGGMDKKGIDCSAFMQRLLGEVYGIYIPRTSVDQFFADWVDRFGSRTDLSEGDLVFFKTMKGKAISHVGLYLGNRMFINSSSSKGVSFGNLDDPYWKPKYVAAGRIKQNMLGKARL